MTSSYPGSSDPRVQAAIIELQALIHARYPETVFDVADGYDPDGVYLTATVDLADPDEVMDVVVDRLMDLLEFDDVAIVVVPIRTPERREAMRAERDTERRRLDVTEVLRR